MLLADYGYSGNHFGTVNGDGAVNQSQFLILGVILLVVWFLLTAMMTYYFVQFMKTKSDHKLYGRTMLWVDSAVSLLELIFAVLVLAFWGNGGKIWGWDKANDNYHALVAMTVLGFISLAANIVIMWVCLPQFGIAFDGKRILFMGEDIQYATITKIIIDDKSGDTYVNYTRGKRTHKKLRFAATSAFGLFIRENSSLTGHTAEPGNEREYFQSLLKSDRKAEADFNKQVNNKIANKDARTTSKPKEAAKKVTTSKDTKKDSSTKSTSKPKNK